MDYRHDGIEMTDYPNGDAPQARSRQRGTSKPLYKRWWVWTLAALVVLSATGLFGQTDDSSRTVEATSSEDTEPIAVPDLVGKAGDEAKDELVELDLKADLALSLTVRPGGCPYVLSQGVAARFFKNIRQDSKCRDDRSGNWLPD